MDANVVYDTHAQRVQSRTMRRWHLGKAELVADL